MTSTLKKYLYDSSIDLFIVNSVLQKIQMATGPSRELDARIHQALFPDKLFIINLGNCKGENDKNVAIKTIDIDQWKGDFEGLANAFDAKYYTSSVDSALNILSKILTDWQLIIGDIDLINMTATDSYVLGPNYSSLTDKDSTPPVGTRPIAIAILSCLFLALCEKAPN